MTKRSQKRLVKRAMFTIGDDLIAELKDLVGHYQLQFEPGAARAASSQSEILRDLIRRAVRETPRPRKTSSVKPLPKGK